MKEGWRRIPYCLRNGAWCTVANAMDRNTSLTQALSMRSLRLVQLVPLLPLGLAPTCLAGLALALLSCASPFFPGGGPAPIAIEYRVALFSALPMRLIGLSASDCIAGKKTESMEYVYPSGRRVSVEVSTERGFAFTLREGELSLHELPLEGGLQVAGLADLKVSERQMRKAEKFRAAHERCELVVFVDGELVDLLVGAKSWEKGLPAGRFPTLDEARAVYQREGISIIIVPEALEVTRWRREFSRWKSRDTRWRFRCDPAFRRVMKRDYPDTHQRLKREDKLFVSLSCRERPRPPLRPPPPPTATP